MARAKKSKDQQQRERRAAKLSRLRLAWVTAMVRGEYDDALRQAEVDARRVMAEKST